ncbi:MAG: MerC domain-containing protein [Pseudomonadota bacterium]
MQARQTSSFADVMGVSASGLCILHCLALPLAAAALPLAGALAEAEWIHRLLVIMAALVAAFAFFTDRTGTGRAQFALLAGGGVALLVAGAFVEVLHDWETPLTVAGAVLLSIAHILRWRGHRPHRTG